MSGCYKDAAKIEIESLTHGKEGSILSKAPSLPKNDFFKVPPSKKLYGQTQEEDLPIKPTSEQTPKAK